MKPPAVLSRGRGCGRVTRWLFQSLSRLPGLCGGAPGETRCLGALCSAEGRAGAWHSLALCVPHSPPLMAGQSVHPAERTLLIKALLTCLLLCPLFPRTKSQSREWPGRAYWLMEVWDTFLAVTPHTLPVRAGKALVGLCHPDTAQSGTT